MSEADASMETDKPVEPCAAMIAERLNRGCFCVTLDKLALAGALDLEAGTEGFAESLANSHPSLFSNVPVFVPAGELTEMARVVKAVEAVSRLTGYRDESMAWAPPIAKVDFGPIGALMGYDFHVTPDGPSLIEINTNAGGAFLNAVAARAQQACCASARLPFEVSPVGDPEHALFDMFVQEWRRQRGSGQPSTIAIVDDNPDQQYLYPEFSLAKALLEKGGIRTIIADAVDLSWDGSRLTHRGQAIDLVYNRLVDFALEEPRHAALRAAYVGRQTVVTPNPHIHALLADKRNLTLLSDAERLKAWGLSPDEVDILSAAVPKTVVLTPANADDLWEQRRGLFFKPARGHGSKAAYRGDKITRKVWAEILESDYVAQSFVAPGGRTIEHDHRRAELKVDIRLYTYAGTILLAAARLYQGQTTNMRTPGGGFAAVLATPGLLTRAKRQ